ncbi:MAG: hypothetical protein U0183_08765 [Polyangiaceae bacterium]
MQVQAHAARVAREEHGARVVVANGLEGALALGLPLGAGEEHRALFGGREHVPHGPLGELEHAAELAENNGFSPLVDDDPLHECAQHRELRRVQARAHLVGRGKVADARPHRGERVVRDAVAEHALLGEEGEQPA